jgi:sialate O-acetylesterase
MVRLANQVGCWLLFFALLCLAGLADARAEVKLPSLVSDRMVLQQWMAVAVWGTADPGEIVTVRFRAQEATGAAGTDGRWRAWQAPVEALRGSQIA